MPEVEIPTACVAISHPSLSPDALEFRLRAGDPPVVARIGRGKLLIDLRTVADAEIDPLAAAIAHAASEAV